MSERGWAYRAAVGAVRSRWVQLPILVWAVCQCLGIDIFPVLSNDSLFYRSYAQSGFFLWQPWRVFVPYGLKTGGYPLFLSLVQELNWTNFDPLTFVAVFQRLLYLAASWQAVRTLGLFSLPVLLLLLNPVILVHANLVLTEGMTSPLSVIFALSLYELFNKTFGRRKRAGDWTESRIVPGVLMSVSGLFLVLTKCNLAAFMLPLGAFIVHPRRPGDGAGFVWFSKPKQYLAALPLLVFSLVFIVSLSVYNAYDAGVFSPVPASGRAFYWGAWYSTFKLREENSKRPELQEFYGGGTIYDLVHKIEDGCGGVSAWRCTNPLIVRKGREMLERAGISLASERFRSVSNAVFGGEKQEIDGLRAAMLKANGKRADYGELWMSRNQFGRANGAEAFYRKYNEGLKPETVRGFKGPIIDFDVVAGERWAVQLGFVALCLLVWRRRSPFVALGLLFLLSHLIVAFSAGWFLLDIKRYLFATCLLFTTSTCAAVRHSLASGQWGTLNLRKNGSHHRGHREHRGNPEKRSPFPDSGRRQP